MFRRILIYALGAVFLTAGGVRAQQPEVEARIAGLEGNAEYMSLLREDAQLQIREDSIVNAVERMRRQLREDPGKRQQYSQEILQLESRIFEIRNAKGRLIDRINTIEQEWVLANLNGASSQPAGPAAENPAAEIPDSLKVRNLVSRITMPIAVHSEGLGGQLFTESCRKRAQAACIIEIPSGAGDGAVNLEFADVCFNGLIDMLKSEGVAAGKVEGHAPTFYGKLIDISAPHAGLWQPEREIGAAIRAGERIGRMDATDVYAPADGMLIACLPCGYYLDDKPYIGMYVQKA